MDDYSDIYTALKEKLDNAILQYIQLKRANLNMKKEVKHLRRVIKNLKEDAAKDRKPYYRNGQKRGRSRNG